MTDVNFVDSRVFDPEAVDPETEKFNKKIEALLATMPPTHTKTPQEVREERESGESWMGAIKRLDDARDRVVSSRGQNVTVPGFPDGHGTDLVQPLGEGGGEPRGHVLHDGSARRIGR